MAFGMKLKDEVTEHELHPGIYYSFSSRVVMGSNEQSLLNDLVHLLHCLFNL